MIRIGITQSLVSSPDTNCLNIKPAVTQQKKTNAKKADLCLQLHYKHLEKEI